jgi:hypothetical protein
MSKPGDIVACLAKNNFNNNAQQAGSFYEQNRKTYKKDALPKLDLSRVKYSAAGTNAFDLYSNDGAAIGKLRSGNVQVSLPANIVAAGGGNIVAAGGGNIVAAGGGNIAGSISSALDRNPPTSPKSGYALQGVNDLRGLKAKSTGR